MLKATDPSFIRRVTPERIMGFASFSGWIRVSNKRTDVAVFKAPDDAFTQLIIPLNSSYDDYPARAAEAVEKLARRENRELENVLEELVEPLADLLEFRLADASTKDGSVPFAAGLDLLHAAEKSIRASACSVVSPQSFFKRLSRAESDLLVERTKLGQTRHGSFVAVIVIPMDAVPIDPQQRLFGAADTPFARRTTAHLMESLDHLSALIHRDAVGSVTAPTAGGVQLTANLCDALLDVSPTSGQGELEISVTWAKTDIPRPAVATSIKLVASDFVPIQLVAQQLRPTEEPETAKFIGKVFALMGKPNDQDVMEGDTILQFQVDEHLLKAKLTLGPAAYALACDAHKAGAYVSVQGVLQRRFRVHQIDSPSEFARL